MRDIKPRQVNKSVVVNRPQAGNFSNTSIDKKRKINTQEKSVERFGFQAQLGERQRRVVDTAVDISGHKFSSAYYDSNSTGVEHLEEEGARKVKSKIKKPLSSRRKISGAIFLFGLMMILFIFTELTSVDIFFWLFFLAMFWYRLDSRISIGGALAGLVAIMFLSAGQGFGWWQVDDLMEQIAVGVYFFLVIGVVKQIWEYREESKVKSL